MKLKFAILAGLASTLTLSPAVAFSMPLTAATLIGSWELHTSCMNDHGKPGACIEMKPGSLRFTFKSDGNWSLAADDVTKTKKAGMYEFHGSRLILKNADGSVYQNSRPDLSADSQHFLVVDRELVETFDRVQITESQLE